MSEFTTVKIKKTALEQLREMATKSYRSAPAHLEMLIDVEYQRFKIVSVGTLPRPTDGEAVPLIMVQPE